ncbi:MAG: class I SAM-dependent methyltransferase [Bacilli bacterium]|nr:class I SAM-dependent methyltransferase [Bacilli bacterium]
MEKWEKYLTNTREKNYNLEHLDSIKKNSNKLVHDYVLRSLAILDSKQTDDKTYHYVSEALKWMDVAKVGTAKERKKWKKKGYDLYAHNYGSSDIYRDDNENYDEIVRILVRTHGLIGQYIRGEVKFSHNKDLYSLIERKLITKQELKKVLELYNECLISATSKEIYDRIKEEIKLSIDRIINNDFDHEFDIIERISRLNGCISEENKKELRKILKNKKLEKEITKLFDSVGFWYYESSLSDFSMLEQMKILAICSLGVGNVRNITFEHIMKTIYIDYKGKRVINLFKKRIVEEYLRNIELDDILNNHLYLSPHISFKLTKTNNALLFDFKFSIQATKLIDFCMVASTSDSIYKKSIYLLYDLFGFRKDEYDRFYNEIEYLNTMNSSLQYKAKILDYMVGKNILDVGPGGGALMDLIEERDPSLNVYGIDISANVIDTLSKKKLKEKKAWNLVKGDALNLQDYFEKGSLDTIIYSSIIHELYSYIPYEGKKFNINTVIKALKSAYDILSVNGRIIIRDGIKTEPENQYRIIEFRNIEDLKILDRYCHDFKGRKITYEKVDDNKVKMLVNDAMEFLYTYTWGEDSYPLEVQEQFGYLTPSEYKELITKNLPNSNIIMCVAYLQGGYEEHLLNKISIYDENMNVVKLPNSTCITVIEKTQ